MSTELTCAVLATILSFTSAWLLARLMMAALLLCMPRGTSDSYFAKGSGRPCA